MRRPALILLLLTFLLGPSPLAAQETPAPQTAVPEAPVYYDADRLSPAFHQSRREAVLAALPEDAVAFFFSAPVRNRENDVDFPYRQDSDLYYLTGTTEPGSILMLAPAGIPVGDDTVRELLFVPPRNPQMEQWLGRRLGAERAEAVLGVGRAITSERFEEIAGPLLSGGARPVFHLPLPTGVEGGDLSEQLAFFRAHATLLPEPGNPRLGRFAQMLLAADTPEAFAQARTLTARFGRADLFEPGFYSDLYAAFTGADTFAAWQQWRADHLDHRFADGATLRSVLTVLRTVKEDEEMRLLQRAIDITTEAQRAAMRAIAPGMHEYEVEALIEYVFMREGAESPGFPSIVGSGENAIILHYDANRRRMEAGDMVVMDIGAEYHGYTADVTRTVPVDGRFSDEERAIYDLVLAAQEAGIAATRAGNGFGAPHQAAQAVLAEGLQRLGLLDAPSGLRRFFPHGTSHYLGLYVHDVGTGGPLLPGTVITVEPGLYIPAADDIDPRWWHIGVRIEDDILVTDGDPVVLSAAAPRTAAAIEALMAEEASR